MGDRIPVSIPPGVHRGATPSGKPGTWYEANMVRWMDGIMRPLGSIERAKFTGATFASPCRAIHSWQDLSGIIRTAFVCERHVYVEEGNVIRDITPTGGITGPSSNLLQGGYGDWEYSNAAAIPDYNPGTGLGGDKYGTPRPDRIEIKAIGPAYTVDNWGEDLLVCNSVDGRLLRWHPSVVGALLEKVPNAPDGLRTFVVTPERHVIAFQMYADPPRWGWCDQEDVENWNVASLSSLAGEYSIEPSAPIIAAKSTRYGVIIFTTDGIYTTRYVGVPYVYSGAEKIADASTPLSSQAIVGYSDNVMWWGTDGFWMFDGSNISPVSCPLIDYARRRMNNKYRNYRVSGFAIGTHPEIYFYYPSGESTENDSYVVYHFFERWWSMGFMSRTAGQPAGLLPNPVATDGSNVYLHERGFTNTYADQPILPYAKTSNMNLQSGASMMTLLQIIPDYGSVLDAVLFDFEATNVRTGTGIPGKQTKTNVATRKDGYLDVRISGRDHVITIKQKGNGAGAWSFGEFLAEIAGRGLR